MKEVIAQVGHLHPAQLNAFMLGGILAAWKKRLRRGTVAIYASQLRQFLVILRDFGAPRLPAPKVPPQEPRAHHPTEAELMRLFATPSLWFKLYMLLYLQCGLRSSETLRLTPASWDQENHCATLSTKGDRPRVAQLTPEVEEILAACDPHEDQQEESYIAILRGRRIGVGGLQRAWLRHKTRCGINPALVAHDLRRTAATILYAATKDLRVPQQLLGHKHLSSTLRYLAPLAPEEARRYGELLRFDRFHQKEGEKPQ